MKLTRRGQHTPAGHCQQKHDLGDKMMSGDWFIFFYLQVLFLPPNPSQKCDLTRESLSKSTRCGFQLTSFFMIYQKDQSNSYHRLKNEHSIHHHLRSLTAVFQLTWDEISVSLILLVWKQKIPFIFTCFIYHENSNCSSFSSGWKVVVFRSRIALCCTLGNTEIDGVCVCV